MEWDSFKSLKGFSLAGIWSNQLFIHQSGNEWDYSFGNLIINLKKEIKTTESWYWRIYWFENEDGDDLLCIEEQATPEPLDYYYEPEISKTPLITGSKISLENSLIKKVSGYGFKFNNNDYLTAIVFELEKQYVTFELSGPIINAKISDVENKDLGNLLFSM